MATIDRRGATVSAADPPIGTNPNPDLAIKAPVRVATTGSNITLSGLQTIDGVALAAGDRVLVKDQTDATTNGLYNASTGNWTRTVDANNNSQWTQGTQVKVAQGAVNANANWTVTTANPIILGTSLLTFVGFSPSGQTGYAVNVADFGADPTGAKDSAAAISSAIASFSGAKGRVLLGPGTFIVGTSGQLLPNVDVIGAGIGATTIKLKNGANVDVLQGSANLFGSASTGGVSFMRLSDLTIDGNKANNTSGSGIALYGFRFNLSNLRIQNCAEYGLRTEWAAGGDFPMESNYDNILIDTTGKHGWWNNGPHDSNARNVIVVDAGQAANNTWDGIFLDANTNFRADALHTWLRSTSTNRTRYGLNDTSLGGNTISNSNFEGSWSANALINSTDNSHFGCAYFSPWNGTNLIVKAAGNQIFGLVSIPGAGRPASVGVVLGQGGDNASLNIIDLSVISNNLGAVDFTNSANFNKVRVRNFQTTGPAYISNPAAADDVELYTTGAATSPVLVQRPTPESTAKLTNVTTNYTVLTTDAALLCNGGGSITLTLPAVAAYAGRWLYVKTIANQTVVSASANVIPLVGGAAGTAILAATAGKWAALQCDGSFWQVMMAN